MGTDKTMQQAEETSFFDKDFEDLFGQYYKPLCAAAFAYLRNQKDAEDVVQQIFVQLWEKRKQYEAKKSTKNYLFVAVRNACLNKLQRRPKQIVPLSHDLEESARQAMEIMLDEERYRILMSALDSLSQRNRAVFEMVYFENKTYNETAQTLSLSVNTVKWHLKRALVCLRGHPVLKAYFLKK